MHVDLATADRMVAQAKTDALNRADEINKKLMDQHQLEVRTSTPYFLFSANSSFF